MRRRRSSSGGPGKVLGLVLVLEFTEELDGERDWDKPRLRFLCIMTSFRLKCSADWMGYDFVRAER